MFSNNDINEVRDLLAREMGVPKRELPFHVVIKAIRDPLYLHHLINCKSDTFLLNILFTEASLSDSSAQPDLKNTELLRNAFRATVRWLTSGAKLVDNDEYRKRIEACKKCPNLAAAPSSPMYELLRSRLVCSLCGCDVERKAKLLSERCPDREYGENGRWV